MIRTLESWSSIQRTGISLIRRATSVGQGEELGVEEPPVVLDLRDQIAGQAGVDRLEATLGVGDAIVQKGPREQVVDA